ncbi:lactate utilization protein [Candidatus Woesearchaeota archaeon]|nr:lactate utilization protein [Candidatus Woesearchaeota archaeon]
MTKNQDSKYDEIIRSLNKRNLNAIYVRNKEEATEKIYNLIKKKNPSTIGVFGSVTIRSLNLLNKLRQDNFKINDPYDQDYDTKTLMKIKTQCFYSDLVLMSVNALTKKGVLINTDGLGNRVAAMLFGPGAVIIATGINKIVKDIEEGKKRIKEIAAPLNTKRLNIPAPCFYGHPCVNCASNNCICRYTLIHEKHKSKDRMYLFLIGEELGY